MESPARLPLPRRRLALFLFVFLVPFGVLTTLAIRTLSQDRELAVRREEDDRRQLAAAIRQEFLGRLEGLKLGAASGASDATQANRARDPSETIVLVASIDGHRLVLPWERHTSSADVRRTLAEEPFAGLIVRGETEELVHARSGAASDLYRRALEEAREPAQTASAELLLARALGKAGRAAEALEYSRKTMARPLPLVDEQAVPFALYAARRVADLEGLTIDVARVALDSARRVGEAPATAPAAAHMAAAIVATLSTKGSAEVQTLAAAVQPVTAARIAIGEQALALQQTFPALARQFPATDTLSETPLWLPFGQWLIGLTAATGGRPQMLIAVDAMKAFDRLESSARCAAAGGCRLALASGADANDYPLGPALPGLTLLDVTSGVTAESPGWLRKQWFYVAALSLVLALVAFGAYLLWRDVRRELRVAEMRSQFVSSVSHELKTPLTAIRMFAETLRMGRPADPALRDEYLDTIVNESERLTRLLNNVLEFSRIESGRKIYQFAPHDLESIVRTAARAMRYPLAQQGFELLVDIGDNIPPVQCDPDAVEQAILNLLANALKYSGDARKIELRLARGATNAVISVRDWGIGIDPADQRRIFDKFYRVARPENRQIPGTGLGLSLVDHIVRSHHGRIDVDSTPGAGSTFRIHLPLPEGPASSEGVRARESAPGAVVVAHGD